MILSTCWRFAPEISPSEKTLPPSRKFPADTHGPIRTSLMTDQVLWAATREGVFWTSWRDRFSPEGIISDQWTNYRYLLVKRYLGFKFYESSNCRTTEVFCQSKKPERPRAGCMGTTPRVLPSQPNFSASYEMITGAPECWSRVLSLGNNCFLLFDPNWLFPYGLDEFPFLNTQRVRRC